MPLRETLGRARVLPVITAHSVDATVQLCRTLYAGGMQAVEITLRTPRALDAIRAVRAEVPELLVAAGTVVRERDVTEALAAGATLLVSPGSTPALLRAAQLAGVDFLPGVATASEVMQGLEHGRDCFKLFPAARVGGQGLLRALAGPFPEVSFCPTGGLDRANFREYLALPNVLCCGGSWMATQALVQAGDWEQIRRLAAEAMASED